MKKQWKHFVKIYHETIGRGVSTVKEISASRKIRDLEVGQHLANQVPVYISQLNDRYGGILKFSEEKIHLRERLLLKSLYRHVPIMIILGGGYVKYDNPSLTTSRKNTLHHLHTIFFEELEKQTDELSSTF